jgi:hypothetical protein
MTYTEDDLGEVVSYDNDDGRFEDERIVLVFCRICSARFIGPIRQAGGFLGAHEMFHQWEFSNMVSEMEA